MAYGASPIKRRRATKAEIEARACFLIDYARQHGPVTIRGLYYQAEVAGVPGIGKDEKSYRKVQNLALQLRRAGRLEYHLIADHSRWMRRPTTFDGWQDALFQTAQVYRKSLWAESDFEVEIWVEKSALAGVILPVTSEYDVPLMPTGGYTSETFAHEAIARLADTGKQLVVYSLYDFDRSGQDAARSLEEKVKRFGAEYDVTVTFHRLGLDRDMVLQLGLPTRPAKRTSAADQRWPHPFAAELDAIPPDTLRSLVRTAIEWHLPATELASLKQIEALERKTLTDLVGLLE